MSFHSAYTYTQKIKNSRRGVHRGISSLQRFRQGAGYREYDSDLDGSVIPVKRIRRDRQVYGEEKPLAQVSASFEGEGHHLYNRDNPQVARFLKVMRREVTGSGREIRGKERM